MIMRVMSPARANSVSTASSSHEMAESPVLTSILARYGVRL